MQLTAEVLCDMSSARFPVLHASPGIQKMYGGQGTGDFFDAWHVDDCAIHAGTGSRGVTRAVLARPSAGKIETTDLWPRQVNSHESYCQGFFFLMAFLMDPHFPKGDIQVIVRSSGECEGCHRCSVPPVNP